MLGNSAANSGSLSHFWRLFELRRPALCSESQQSIAFLGRTFIVCLTFYFYIAFFNMALVPPRLYFAYGSSLSLSEMISRCPTSSFYSIALLRNHRWFVNERGYANVIPSMPGGNGFEDVVWGILYTLRPFDEDLLDKHEGLPWAYSKEDMDVEAISITGDGRGTRREIVRALVYIDRERVQQSYAWPEFVAKMKKGITDAVERGVPRIWFDNVVRSYIVETGATNVADQEAADEARPQPQNGGQAAPVTTRESDRASNTQDSVVRGQLTNGGSQKGTLNRNNQFYGLENSKYAHEGAFGDVRQRKAIKGQERPSARSSSANLSGQSRGNKLLECWWWKAQGSCRYPDHVCQFAHFDTGVLADAPGKKKKGPPLERDGSLYQLKKVYNQEKGKWSKNPADKESNEHPYGYAQDWSGQSEGQAEPQGKVDDFDGSSNQQVENLMDSQPDWLASNDRTDVKW